MKKPTIAIVEDKRLTRERLRQSFQSPEAEWQKESGLSGFNVETAGTANEARQLFSAARESGRTIDVLWIDLGLPIDSSVDDSDDNPRVGLEILEDLRDEFWKHPDSPVVGGVIVGSNKAHELELVHMIRARIVNDFFAKPWDSTNRDPFFSAVKIYRQRQAVLWGQYKIQRQRRWFEEAERNRVSKLTRVVTNSVSKAAEEVRMLMQTIEAGQHLSLTLDRAHPICKQVINVQDSILKITKDCAEEREELFTFDEPDEFVEPKELGPQTVDALFERAIDAVNSGLAVKVIHLDTGSPVSARIGTSAYHAGIVLEVILFGAVDGSQPDGRIATEMNASGDGWTVTVSVLDQGQPLPAELLESIQKAEPGDLHVGSRAWELAMAQHVALNVGGRVEVSVTEEGNLVTLHLPLARS